MIEAYEMTKKNFHNEASIIIAFSLLDLYTFMASSNYCLYFSQHDDA